MCVCDDSCLLQSVPILVLQYQTINVIFFYCFSITNCCCYIVMYLQIRRSLFAINQCSVGDRLDQMIVGQLLNEHWRNGSWVSKYGQNPCKFSFKFVVQFCNFMYELIFINSLINNSLERILNNW